MRFPLRVHNDTIHGFSAWSSPVNRTMLKCNKGLALVPWQITIHARLLNAPTEIVDMYAASFFLLDPWSDPYLSWDFGSSLNYADVKFTNFSRPLIIRNPCNKDVIIVAASVPSDDGNAVYFGRSWSHQGINISSWQKGIVLPVSCELQSATSLVDRIILHTTCGAYVSNVLTDPSAAADEPSQTGFDTFEDRPIVFNSFSKRSSSFDFVKGTSSKRTIIFSPAPLLNDFMADRGGTVSDYCYLRTDALGLVNALSFNDSSSGRINLVKTPFESAEFPIFNYNFSSTDEGPGSTARRAFFDDIQSDFKRALSAFLHSPSNVYYVLYHASNNRTKIFAQGLKEMQKSSPTGYVIFQFPPNSNFLPQKFIVNPITNFLYVLGNQIWVDTHDGRSFRKIFDQRSSSMIDQVSFSSSGSFMVFTTDNHSIYTGDAFDGPFALSACGLNRSEFTTYFLDPADQLTWLDLTDFSITVACPKNSETFSALDGEFGILPSSSTAFYLVDLARNSSSNLFESSRNQRFLRSNNLTGEHHGTITAYVPGSETVRKMLRIEVPDGLGPTAQNYQNASLTVNFSSDGTNVTFEVSNGDFSGERASSTILAEQLDDHGLVVFRGSFVLTDPANLSGSALVSPLNGTTNITFLPPEWRIFSLANSALLTASLSRSLETTCSYALRVNNSKERSFDFLMDRGETITLLVSLTRTQSTETDPAARLLPNGIIHATGAAPRFKVQTKLTGNAVDGWNLQYDIEEAGSLRQLDYEGMSVVFRMERPGSCRDSVITVNVFSGCPKGSAIQYVFPDGISDEEYDRPSLYNKMGDPILGFLPVNYRPPSDVRGIDYPTSPNVYNADPSQSISRYFGPNYEEHPAVFKQCANATTQNECNCTKGMRRSMSKLYTDCIQQVLNLPYPGDHIFKFRLFDDSADYGLLPPDEPIILTEINDRTDFIIGLPDDVSTSTLGVLRDYYPDIPLYTSSNTTIRFNGTGLFHFQVTTLPSFSYCNLTTEFIFFLYKPPLSFPMGQVCQCATLLAVSIWLFFALRRLGEATLLDQKRDTGNRPPDRIPLEDSTWK